MSEPLRLRGNAVILILTSATIICLAVLALLVRPFIPALVWSLTLAVMFAPLELRLRTKTRSPTIAVVATLLLAMTVVVLPVVSVASALMNEVIAGAGTYAALLSPEGLARMRISSPQLAILIDNLDRWLDLPQLLQMFANQLGRWSGRVVQGSATGIITLLLTFYFLFYFLRDKDRILAACERIVPLTSQEFAEFTNKTVQTVFASVYGTAAVAALQGFLGGLMFWFLGLPSPVFWGVVMGLLAIVPFLGAFVVWVPAAIGLALGGHWPAAITLAVWGTVVVGLIDNIVYPILVGKRLSLHPMLSFIAIVGGLLLFGAHGIVLGPLAIGLARALLEALQARIEQQHAPVKG